MKEIPLVFVDLKFKWLNWFYYVCTSWYLRKKTLNLGFKDRSFNIFHFLFFIKSPFGMCRMLRTKCWTWNTCQLVNRITTLTYMETLKFPSFSKVQVSKETENHLPRDSANFVAKFHRSHLLLDSVNNWKVMYVDAAELWCPGLAWQATSGKGTPETFSSKLSQSQVFCCLWFIALTRANLGLKD